MKLHGEISVNGKKYRKGSEISWLAIYPFFMIHMLMFGGAGFFMAYSESDVPLLFLYLHGGFALLVYTVFYLAIFGVDQIKWMFINSALGCLAIYTQIDWLLGIFGKTVDDFPPSVHVIPFFYFVLYTFLLRQAVLDISGARENESRQTMVEYAYVALSVLVYAGSEFA